MLSANIVLKLFHEGGWVMWPVAATLFLAITVLIERTVWWIALKRSLRPDAQEQAREALGTGNFDAAWQIGSQGSDPFLTNLNEGMSHAHTSMLAAMHLHATQWIEKSEARMWILGTIITLAPLLGLLGTVVGLMGSFATLGDEELGVTKVTGGIAEALIATAAGLGIAIGCLLPYNYFRKRVSAFRGAFERWINHAELLVQSAKAHGHDLEDFATSRHTKR
ncbi:MotA/TolQ/ExbB proton channel family protein [Luteolibacter sp. GHJ8]|uniref:MotA/TolQ/ExbB proton channel family protein n=1 Tax=Luteolibacter rhizosphaerae TaxID=2989719 RepID=A0ABT3G1B3_9BACT|nr:MotA/TolQ/ExbB proton channel family protein [Luteolibacter rhizosphaerae]MCW1913627.1 MotA/TolQ/ExbB proton channel family protein [Luteolibacter rhizosphaerae]